MSKRIRGGDSISDGRVKREVFKRARAQVVTELALKGVPRNDIAEHFAVSKSTVKDILKWSEQNGIVEEVRERIKQELLPKAERVYTQILDASAESIADRDVQKGWELKLKAAKHISDGVGAFRKEQSPTLKVREDLGLEGYYRLREERLKGAQGVIAQQELSGGFGDSLESAEDGDVVEGLVLDVRGEGGSGDS